MNLSVIEVPDNGLVTLEFDVISDGFNGPVSEDAQVYLNGSWHAMTDTSGGNKDSFRFTNNFNPFSSMDVVEIYYKVTNKNSTFPYLELTNIFLHRLVLVQVSLQPPLFPLYEFPATGPTIEYVTPTNYSLVEVGLDGLVNFSISLFSKGVGAGTDIDADVYLNGSWHAMSDVSGGNSDQFNFSTQLDFVDYWMNETYYNVTNDQGVSNVFRLNFTMVSNHFGPSQFPLYQNPVTGPTLLPRTPTNFSVIPVDPEGWVTFQVDVFDNGTGAGMDEVAQIYLNGSWHDMLDTSGGHFTNFSFAANYHPVTGLQQNETYYRVTNDQDVTNYFRLIFSLDVAASPSQFPLNQNPVVGPSLELVTPQNQSTMMVGRDGTVPFTAWITSPGVGAQLAGVQVYLNNSWHAMTDVSGGGLTLYALSNNYTPYASMDQADVYFKVSNDQGYTNYFRLLFYLTPGYLDHPLFQNPSLGPQIEYLTPQNNSYVTGTKGEVPFLIRVITPGTLAELTGPARIFLNGSWHDMLDASGGAKTYFGFFSEFSTYHGQTIEVYYNLTNSNGYSNLFKQVVTVDNEAPTQALHVPTANQMVAGDVVLSVQATDALSGVEAVRVVFTEAFPPFAQYAPVDLTYNGASGRWEYAWAAATNQWTPGPYDLAFTTIDHGGMSVQETRRVTVDYSAPSVLLLSPANNTLVSGHVTARLQINDPTTGLKSCTVQLGADPTRYPLNASGAGLYELPLDTTNHTDGSFNYTVFAENNALLVNQSTFFYSIDNTAPAGLLTLPPGHVLTGLQRLTVACSDLTSIGRVAWRIDNRSYHDLDAVPFQNFTIDTARYAGGSHNLTIRLEDGATPANVIEIPHAVVIDRLTPNVGLRNLRPGAAVTPLSVLEIQVYDDLPTLVNLSYAISTDGNRTMDYIPLAKQNATDLYWLLPVANFSLEPGVYYLHLRGVDLVGHVDEDVVMFVLFPAPYQSRVWVTVLVVAGIVAAVGVAAYLVHRRRELRARGRVIGERLSKSQVKSQSQSQSQSQSKPSPSSLESSDSPRRNKEKSPNKAVKSKAPGKESKKSSAASSGKQRPAVKDKGPAKDRKKKTPDKKRKKSKQT